MLDKILYCVKLALIVVFSLLLGEEIVFYIVGFGMTNWVIVNVICLVALCADNVYWYIFGRDKPS